MCKEKENERKRERKMDGDKWEETKTYLQTWTEIKNIDLIGKKYPFPIGHIIPDKIPQ